MSERSSESIIVIVFVMLAVFGAFWLGYHNGKNQWTKPCDQFAKWQYDQNQVRKECYDTERKIR